MLSSSPYASIRPTAKPRRRTDRARAIIVFIIRAVRKCDEVRLIPWFSKEILLFVVMDVIMRNCYDSYAYNSNNKLLLFISIQFKYKGSYLFYY